MSTATKFKFYRPFPYCPPSSSPGSQFDYVDVTQAEAMALYWNLEDLQITTSGSYSGTAGDVDIDWSTQIGATESFPFTLTSAATRAGPYYDGSTPASAPRSRVCYNGAATNLLYLEIDGSSGTSPNRILKSFLMDIRLGAAASVDMVRVYYNFRANHSIESPSALFPGEEDDTFITFTNPNAAVVGLPDSGSFSIMGISFDWEGGIGDRIYPAPVVFYSGVSGSASSSAFTY